VGAGAHSGRVGAAVDLGSTSVHLLVARVVEHRIQPLADESVFLGLGAAVGERGFLGAEGREQLCEALASYVAISRRLGAETITLVATEPLRRLADAARIVSEVDAATAVPLHVLTHEEEAFLTLIGVTEGRPVSHEIVVADIGGGSSEFVSVAPGRMAVAAGVRVGAAELTRTFVKHDPLSAAELEAMAAVADAAIAASPGSRPDEVVLVGGTASNLLKIVPNGRLAWRMTPAELEAAFAIVRTDDAAAIADRYAIRLARARILGAGATIVAAIMERYEVDEVRVVDAGVREGTVIAVDHAGPGWRDCLERLAHGWVG
jgi:exopolyphosphatase/guanosine-5'-triphosphate,3'-diphosphate pyrophosphatase